MTKKVVVLPGDGIGVEVTEAALRVTQAAAAKFGMQIETENFLVGGSSIDAYGVPIKDEVLAACKQADAVLLGAVGGPKWDKLDKDKRAEVALLRLRGDLGLYTNLRPVKVFDALLGASSLRHECIQGCDVLVVRELTGGIYFGKKLTEPFGEGERAIDTMVYTTPEIQRIARVAFDAAMKRGKRVTSVDKANILATSQLWRKTVDEVGKMYPEVVLEHMLVDNCAMQLVRYPKQFDVILTENMFGDILSDEASMLTGSLGMLPSASLGDGVAMYEPVHGSAPEIAGKGVANPLAAIVSAAFMFRFSFRMEEVAQSIENAVSRTLDDGFRSADIAMGKTEGIVGTEEMTAAVIERL